MLDTIIFAIVVILAFIGCLVVIAFASMLLEEKYSDWKKERHYKYKRWDKVIIEHGNRKLLCTIEDRQITEWKKRLYRVTPCVDIYNVEIINDVHAQWFDERDIKKPKWV